MTPDRQRAYPAYTLLFLVNVLNYFDRQALAAIAEPLRHEFSLNDAQLGTLSTAFIVLYAIAGLPLGRAADTGNRKRLLAIGVAVWSGLTGLGALASSYVMLAATRLGVGIGEAVCAPVANSWIGDLAPPERRARAMSGFMMAVPIGVMLSAVVTGAVAQAHGWRTALSLAGAPGLLLIPALMLLHEPARTHVAQAALASDPRSLLSLRPLWYIAASGAILNFALYSFSSFLPAFLMRYHGLSLVRAGVWTGVGSGVFGIAGATAAALFGDRVIKRHPNGRLLLAAAASLAAAPLAFVALGMPAGQVTASLSLLMPAYGLLQMYYGLVYAAINDVAPATLRGTAMAAYLMVTYLGGAAFGPVFTGALSDHFARRAAGLGAITESARAAGLHQAMYVVPVLAVLLAVVLWAGGRAMKSALTHDAPAR